MESDRPASPLALPLLLTTALAALPCAAQADPLGSDGPPHIVLVMADDMGYSDIGCYGSEIRTPHLDRLAAGGVRMTQFYNTSRCCPTRASLLTGLYSHQAGIGLMEGDRGYEAYRGYLNRRCVTLAEALGEAGYRCYMSGKWHVAGNSRPDGPKERRPLGRGFDRFYGTIIGAGSFYDPATLCRGETYITPENDEEYAPGSYYYTEAISDQAVRFVTEHLEASRDPFFLYVSYTSAHWPMHAPEEAIAEYADRYGEGYAPVRAARLARARELGVVDPSWGLSEQAEEWSRNPHPEWDQRNMQVYAAMVTCMDEGIGRLVKTLEDAGQLDRTLFVYLQDNGACAENMGRRSNLDKEPEEGLEPMAPDELQSRIWPPMSTRDGRWVGTGPEVMAGAEDTYVAYGRGWANVSNTPFRGYKHDAYEGGISTPFIVHWPQGLGEEAAGTIVDEPGHLIDIMPTFLAAAGGRYPSTYGGHEIQPMEGLDLAPTWKGAAVNRTRPFGFEHHGNQALRDGRWKIVSSYRKDEPRVWELYDMQLDRTEQNDLATQEPERLASLVTAWEAWAQRVGVVDWPFESKR